MPAGIMSPKFWRDTGSDQFTYRVRVLATQSTSPKFSYVAGYPPAFIDWGDGSARTASTSGTEYTHAYAVGGEYTVTLIMSNQAKWLSQVDILSDKIITITSPMQLFPAITIIKCAVNATWVQNISSNRLPLGLQQIQFHFTGITGSVGGWIFPSTLISIYLQSTGVSGDVSGWILPNALVSFYCDRNSMTGDISSWILPAGQTIFQIYSTFCTNCPDLSQMVAIQIINTSNCALPQATVDLYLSRCWAREAATTFATPTLNLAGTNAAPSVAGLADKASLVAAGWIVTTT